MDGIDILIDLVLFGLFYALGCSHYRERHRNRRAELSATLERGQILEIALEATADAQNAVAESDACATMIDIFHKRQKR